jgi:hypothetical protein
MSRRRSEVIGIVVALAVLTTSWATGTTLAAFSDSTQNPANSFVAAGSFCASPGTQTLVADADSYVDENAAGSNYGTSATLYVQSRAGGGRNRRALLHFALPPGQYCSVTSATLRLNATTAALGRILQAYQVGSPWTEAGVTWSNQPSTIGSPSTVPSAMGWVQFDVTAQVQAMYAGSNDGFLVKDSVESQNPASLQILSSREGLVTQPELVITLA